MANEREWDSFEYLRGYTKDEIDQLLEISRARGYTELNSYVQKARVDLGKENKAPKKSKSSASNTDQVLAAASAPDQSASPTPDNTKLSVEEFKNYLSSSELELERDLDTKHNPVKPFTLYYASVLDSENKDNVKKVIAALEDGDFKKKYPTAYKEGMEIVSVLKQLQEGSLTKEQASQQLKRLQATAEKPFKEGSERTEVSHKTRARLARQLQLAGNCEYTVRVEKLPDMAWLIPVTHCTNLKDYEQYGYSKGKDFFDPKWRRQNKRGLFYDPRPQYSTKTDEDGLDVRTRLVENLKRRRNELQTISGRSSDVIDFYDLVIDAYTSNDWEKIKKLNSEINTMGRVAAAYDIRHHACFVYPPDNYEQRDLSIKIDQEDIDPPVIEKTLDAYTSDEWKQLIDGAKVGDQMPVFLQMMGNTLHMQEGLEISALKEVLGDDFPTNDFEKLDVDAKEEKIQELKNNLTPAQLAKFNIRVVEDAQKLAEVLPPHQLVVMCKEIDDRLQNNEQQDNKAELDALIAQKQTFVKAMLQKTSDYVNEDTIVDESNVADVYDGALEMFGYLNKQTDIQDYSPERVKQLTKDARDKIDLKIKKYDEINFLTDIKEGDSEKIEESFDKVWNEIKDLDFESEEIVEKYGIPLDTLKSVEFEGSDSDKAEKKKIFIDTIKASVARKVALAALGKNDEEYAKILKTQITDVTNDYVDTLKTTDALSKLPENATEEYRNAAIQQALQATTYTVSDGGMTAFEAAAVNNHMGFLNRLASKNKLNNRAAPVLNKMYGTIAKIDKTCISRFGVAYTAPRDFGRMMLRNMGSQGLNAALRMGCNYGALAFGVPGVGSKVYAAIYAGQAINRLFQARKYEKQLAEERGEKFNEGRYWLSKTPEILMSCAGTAVSFCAGPIAEKGLQAVVRYGMLGAGWMISFAKGIHASRKQGNGWFKSIGKAATNATASTASAVASGALIGCGINIFSNMTSDFWGEKLTHTPNASEYDANDPSYTKDVIPVDELNQNGADLRDLSNEQLAERGMIREPAQAGEEGAYLVQEGTKPYTTHDYADNELAKAEERNSDPRFSEFLNKYHVAPDLQDSANPDIVSSSATENLGSAIEELASHHSEFQTSNEDGTTHTNTQMLMYKLTQMAYLVPNTEAPMDNGSTAGEYFSYTDAEGNTTNYMELLREGIQNGKFSNPDAALEILTKVELHVGGQIDDNINDLGKVEGFGEHIQEGRAVNSYQTNDHGFTVNNHPGSSDVYEKISQVEQHNYIPTVPLFDRIWAGVKDIPGKLRTIMGANGKRKEGVDKRSLKLEPASNQR